MSIRRATEAETIDAGTAQIQLLLDASDTDHALSSHRVHLDAGAEGANPHQHAGSSEIFYVLDGTADVLVDGEVVHATAGDIVVVPPGMTHAFGASAGRDADLLVLVTPGIERFSLFRQIALVRSGAASPATLADSGAQYDTRPAISAAWDAARVTVPR